MFEVGCVEFVEGFVVGACPGFDFWEGVEVGEDWVRGWRWGACEGGFDAVEEVWLLGWRCGRLAACFWAGLRLLADGTFN